MTIPDAEIEAALIAANDAANEDDTDHVGIMRVALEAAARVRGDGWMDISTAPKDGTKFLAHAGNGKMRVDWFDMTLSTSQGANEHGNNRYTHWRPLPAPPQELST